MPGNEQIGFLFPRVHFWIYTNAMRSKVWVELSAHQTILSLHSHLRIPRKIFTPTKSCNKYFLQYQESIDFFIPFCRSLITVSQWLLLGSPYQNFLDCLKIHFTEVLIILFIYYLCMYIHTCVSAQATEGICSSGDNLRDSPSALWDLTLKLGHQA